MIRETFAEYSQKKSNWLELKLIGQYKKLQVLKRAIRWRFYLIFNTVTINRDKLIKNSVPVLINNYDRLASLQAQINWLLSLNENISIIVVDNKSNYPPLLEYYQSLAPVKNCQVVYLNHNSWLKGVNYLAKQLKEFSKLIITDADLLPYEDTPDDVIEHLSNLLDRYPDYNHIGLSLEINDIPDHYPLKANVVKHESQFWPPAARQLNNEVIVAAVHSTFAMYRNRSVFNSKDPALRTTRPYTLKHIDWYTDPESISEEYQHYMRYCQPVASWSQELMATGKIKPIKAGL
ncbi:hypothetical protein [Mucilaginibacter dorajii]|uniref:Glycosyltransferase 2-like domain-containing protein n=1 Tax=Mucilaginibacter dorajii TaxID=692994 RepID=A0ABP7R8I4_9SPHI|nr:hypothetical protein [Mucilaginibacter dorajii]MCS3737420.1 hypothetical protein [Mucilaginibacter dorajii]